MPFRGLVVDNTDPSIKYNGQWALNSSDDLNNLGNFGPALKSTLHQTTQNASFTYEFSGTGIWVVGLNRIRNDSGIIDPTWDCFIDDVRIEPKPAFPFPLNSWEFCAKDSIPDGNHVLRLEATVKRGQPFYFDYLNYEPSPGLQIPGSAQFYHHRDSSVLYEGNWTDSQLRIANEEGAKATLKFQGVSLSMFGGMPTGLPPRDGSATYQIDGGEPVTFTVKSIRSGQAQRYNTPLFETTTLSPGAHTMVIENKGDNTVAPLALNHFIVQRGPNEVTGALSADGPDPSTSSLPDRGGGGGGSNVGAIAGGVVGGLILLAIIVIHFVFYRRRDPNEGGTVHSSAVENLPSSDISRSHWGSELRSDHGPTTTFGPGSSVGHATSLPSVIDIAPPPPSKSQITSTSDAPSVRTFSSKNRDARSGHAPSLSNDQASHLTLPLSISSGPTRLTPLRREDTTQPSTSPPSRAVFHDDERVGRNSTTRSQPSAIDGPPPYSFR